MKDLNERLETLSANNQLYSLLWMYQAEFGKTLEQAIINDNSETMHYIEASSKKFLEITSIQLIKKPDDIIYCIDGVKETKNKNYFLSMFFNHKLLDNQFLHATAKNKYLFQLILNDTRIIEVVMIGYIKLLLENTKHMVGIKEIFLHDSLPDMSPSSVEYYLSWLFEEKRLSVSAIGYFKQHFLKKYEMLNELK